MTRRGYSLIEIALVLVIVSIVSSGLLINFFEHQAQQDQQDARDVIALINDAIVDYATINKTSSRLIRSGNLNLRLPAGRPYLPCPDVTGDGEEDRFAVNPDKEVDFDNMGGNCFSAKGALPWRTLNTFNYDPWGNLFTYRVADSFSSAILGFDEYALLNASSPAVKMTLMIGGDAFRIAHSIGTVVTLTLVAHELGPNIICRTAPCPGTSGAEEDSRNVNEQNVIAGKVAAVNMTAHNPGDSGLDNGSFVALEEGHVLVGIPAVVVSHGQNGYGAFVADEGRTAFRCTDVPRNNNDERQNAMKYTGLGCVALAPRFGDADNIRQYGFVSRQFNLNRNQFENADGDLVQEFDDVVGWLTAEVLFRRMNELGIFPVNRLPAVGIAGVEKKR